MQRVVRLAEPDGLEPCALSGVWLCCNPLVEESREGVDAFRGPLADRASTLAPEARIHGDEVHVIATAGRLRDPYVAVLHQGSEPDLDIEVSEAESVDEVRSAQRLTPAASASCTTSRMRNSPIVQVGETATAHLDTAQ